MSNLPIPEYQLDLFVRLCLEWHQKMHGSAASRLLDPPIEARGWSEDELLTVGIAMRYCRLLARCGFTIREAWQAVPWPAGIDAIRREVAWTLSERERRARDDEAGICDLFDAFDPSRAPQRLRRARAAIRACAAVDDSAGVELAEHKVRLYEGLIAA